MKTPRELSTPSSALHWTEHFVFLHLPPVVTVWVMRSKSSITPFPINDELSMYVMHPDWSDRSSPSSLVMNCSPRLKSRRSNFLSPRRSALLPTSIRGVRLDSVDRSRGSISTCSSGWQYRIPRGRDMCPHTTAGDIRGNLLPRLDCPTAQE